MSLWNSRFITLLLLALLVVFQAQLWFGRGSVPYVWDLRAKLKAQLQSNESAKDANAFLSAQVRDLQNGSNLVEERARTDLGMLKRDEVFVQYAK